MVFLNAYLLGGLLLASVPVIIHLLNRRRFQTVDWAPMKYLKLTLKTNRRRLRIEQLILLALRTLAVLFLILAVARPMLSANAGGWLPGNERTSRVIVVDNSLSTAYQSAGRSAFDSAKEAAAQLLDRSGSQDTVTLLTTAQADDPLVREAALDSSKVLEAVRSITPTDTRSDWPATFRQIDRALAGATFPSREVTILTDLRRSGWGDVSEVTDRWAAQDVRLRIIDAGSAESSNIALLALEQEQAIALPNEPVRVRAQVRNDTAAVVTGASAILTVGDDQGGDGRAGGASRPIILPELPPGQTIDVPILVTPTKPGPLSLRLALAADQLPADGTRHLTIDVRSTLNVALIDGEPGARPFESETDFLSLAFTLGSAPWSATRITDADFTAARFIVPADVYVLANVAGPSPARVAELESLVRSGAGLLIFAGDQLDLGIYNERLFKSGTGLLPARLEGVVDLPATGLVIESQQASPLEPLSKLAPAALTRVQTKKYLGVAAPDAKTVGVRVLARWNNSEATPAVIEKQFGRGRVLLFTTPADKAWGDWPLDPTYVLAVRSAVSAIVRDDAARTNAIAGQPIRIALEKGAVAQQPTATLDGGPSIGVRVTQDPDAPPVIVVDRVLVTGQAKVEWRDGQNRPRSRSIAVSADRAESDLQRIADDNLTQLTGSLTPAIVHYTDASSLADRGREIWRTLAIAVLVMFVIEMCLATWVGRQR